MIEVYKIVTNKYESTVSPVLEFHTKVDVLKDMLMYREDKHQCIFTNEELETIIRHVCTE